MSDRPDFALPTSNASRVDECARAETSQRLRRILVLSLVSMIALVVAGCESRHRVELTEAVASAERELDRLQRVLWRHQDLRRERLAIEKRIVAVARQRRVDPDLSASAVGDAPHPLRPCPIVGSHVSIATMEAKLDSMHACIQRGRHVEASLPRHEKDVLALRERLDSLEALPSPPLDWGSTCDHLTDDDKRLLGFLWELRFPSPVEDVRAVVRGLGEPEGEPWRHSQARMDASFQGLPVFTEFSFSQEVLEYHGVWTRNLDEETAARLHRAVAACLLERLGKVPERTESNDPHEGESRIHEWIVDGKRISLRWHEMAWEGKVQAITVNWGAGRVRP